MNDAGNLAVNHQSERALRYRKRAAELLSSSERLGDVHDRRTLVNLATVFHRMAERLENLKPTAE